MNKRRSNREKNLRLDVRKDASSYGTRMASSAGSDLMVKSSSQGLQSSTVRIATPDSQLASTALFHASPPAISSCVTSVPSARTATHCWRWITNLIVIMAKMETGATADNVIATSIIEMNRKRNKYIWPVQRMIRTIAAGTWSAANAAKKWSKTSESKSDTILYKSTLPTLNYC